MPNPPNLVEPLPPDLAGLTFEHNGDAIVSTPPGVRSSTTCPRSGPW